MKQLSASVAWLMPLALCTMLLGACGGGADREERIEIAVIPKAVSHQFWLTVKAGADAAAEDLGVRAIWQGPAKETEVDRQINIFQDMLSRRVSAIVLAACDENALMGPVQQAMDRGVPIVTIDSGLAENISLSFIATDNIAGAKAAADKFAELLDGEGDLGLIPFVPGAATSELREGGFKEGVAEHPGLRIVATQYSQSDVARAMEITGDMLTAHPNIRGLFAANEPACIGAAQALRAAGRAGDVILIGFDASGEQVNHLREGIVHALVVQNPYKMGYLGVENAYRAIQGEPVEKRIDTGVLIVTQENVDDPDVQAIINPEV